MELIVHPDPETRDLVVAQHTSELINASERFTFGIAGGSTPAGIYRKLRDTATDWAKVEAFLGDERWVPPDDERSNGRMAEETLFAHVDAKLYRPPYGEGITAEDSAASYEQTLRDLIGNGPDLVLLGMGPDRHTASLFPNSPALDEQERWFVANPIGSEMRLTTTLPFLHTAERIMFVANGEAKAEALSDVFEPNSDAPCARVARCDAIVEWHVDEAAASLLVG